MPRILVHCSLALALMLVAASACRAHELWFEPAEDGLVVHWGHVPGARHVGESSVPYEPGAVVEVACRADDGTALAPAEAGVGDSWPVRVAHANGLVAVRLNGGTWTKTVRGTRAGGPEQHPEGLGSWSSWASIKQLGRWHVTFAEPVLTGLELTPVADPFTVHPGDKLDVRVTLAGEPVEGAVVSYQGKPRGMSGPDGVVRVRLRDAGEQRIAATFEEHHAGAAIARTLHESVLVFTLEER